MSTPWYRRPWLWALVGLVAVAVIAVGVVFAAGSDDESSTPSSTPPAVSPTTITPGVTTPGTTVPAAGNQPPPPAGPNGALVVDNQDIYPMLSKSLESLGQAQVTGTKVPVLAVVGPESFWVGAGQTKRLLVHVRTKGRQPPVLGGVKKVTFVGQLSPNGKNAAARYGVTEAAGAALLARQRSHAEVSIADLTLR